VDLYWGSKSANPVDEDFHGHCFRFLVGGIAIASAYFVKASVITKTILFPCAKVLGGPNKSIWMRWLG